MKRELRDKWVRDLRSGMFPQISGTFEYSGGYCCLGVLCKSAGFDVRGDNGEDNYKEVDEVLGKLPEPISVTLTEFVWNDELGKSVSEEVTYVFDLPSILLWRMNDVGNWTFPQIADWVEQNIPVED